MLPAEMVLTAMSSGTNACNAASHDRFIRLQREAYT
jgi:hypothetical protein